MLLIFSLCMAFTAHAQDVPYSKYLNFGKKEFKDNHFKYDDDTNTWSLRKTNGLTTTLNVFAIIADAEEEVRLFHYWQNEKNRKAAQMTDEPGGSKYLIEEITIIDSIIRNLDDFWVYITNTNTGSLKTLTENNAHVLIQELKKIPIENKITSVLADDNVIQLEDAPQISKKIIQQHGEKSIVIENFSGTLNVN